MRARHLLTAALCFLALSGCKDGETGPHAKASKAKAGKKGADKMPQVSAAQVLERAKPLFGALPEEMRSDANPVTDAKIELGRMLYHDARLSKNHDVSCSTCHDLKSFGIDIREKAGTRFPTSPGHKGQLGERNSPTVFNAAVQLAQFWDGRATTVEEQAKGPLVNPVEMALADEAAAVAVVKSIPGYVEKFAEAFPEAEDAITIDSIANAIGAFERRLVTPGPFDEFMQGKLGALTAEQLWGLQLFIDVGCTTCHTGPGVGGTMYQKLGSVKPWETKDVGRFAVTKVEADRFTFKVPTLRNITKTAPYLHDGSIESLEEMVVKMTEHQTAKGTLSDPEKSALLAFLDSLTGTIPSDYVQTPQLPESGPTTPAPDPS